MQPPVYEQQQVGSMELPIWSMSQSYDAQTPQVPMTPRSRKRMSEFDPEEEALTQHQIYYRRAWTPEEDKLLIDYVTANGPRGWSTIASIIRTKNSNQCSQRWNKALDPSIKKGAWSPEEDNLLCTLVEKYRQKWKLISNEIEGRTGKQCRDRYTARLCKTHKTGVFEREPCDLE